VHLEGLAQVKNPMTSSGVKPATFPAVHSYQGQVNGDLCMKIFVRSKQFTGVGLNSISIALLLSRILLPYLLKWKHTLTPQLRLSPVIRESGT
jgi:hypothetical protein